ncbi:MAG: hypothetical protein HQL18_05125, partial [Candidatus Omnitrophica bacterium]|nr:hypothetical protein [Candidatus Omnitrophota bacterium]
MGYFERKTILRRMCALVVLVTFLVTASGMPPYASAQEAALLPAPGSRVELSPAFVPPLLKGIKVYSDNPFHFDFILDKGDAKGQQDNRSTRQ